MRSGQPYGRLEDGVMEGSAGIEMVGREVRPPVIEREASILPSKEAEMLTQMRSGQPYGRLGDGAAGSVIVDQVGAAIGREADMLTQIKSGQPYGKLGKDEVGREGSVVVGNDALRLPKIEIEALTHMESVQPNGSTESVTDGMTGRVIVGMETLRPADTLAEISGTVTLTLPYIDSEMLTHDRSGQPNGKPGILGRDGAEIVGIERLRPPDTVIETSGTVTLTLPYIDSEMLGRDGTIVGTGTLRPPDKDTDTSGLDNHMCRERGAHADEISAPVGASSCRWTVVVSSDTISVVTGETEGSVLDSPRLLGGLGKPDEGGVIEIKDKESTVIEDCVDEPCCVMLLGVDDAEGKFDGWNNGSDDDIGVLGDKNVEVEDVGETGSTVGPVVPVIEGAAPPVPDMLVELDPRGGADGVDEMKSPDAVRDAEEISPLTDGTSELAEDGVE
ncbi:MAG: hypothetical protein Q9164_002341 [Protoblastenia rupestris]